MTVDLAYRRLAHRGRGMASRVGVVFFFLIKIFLLAFSPFFWLLKYGKK
jgi:TRAP-type mannitol/chloroaromatic compound transport system permease small subunit